MMELINSRLPFFVTDRRMTFRQGPSQQTIRRGNLRDHIEFGGIFVHFWL